MSDSTPVYFAHFVGSVQSGVQLASVGYWSSMLLRRVHSVSGRSSGKEASVISDAWTAMPDDANTAPNTARVRRERGW